MDETQTSQHDVTWLTQLPFNRAIDGFVLGNWYLSLALLIAGLVGLTFSRVLLKPSLPERFPRLIWLADVLAGPSLLMLGGSLVERSLFAFGAISLSLYVDLASAIMLYVMCAWLVARGLDLFFWQGFVEVRTGYAVPVLLRGLSYAILLMLVIMFITWRSGYSPTGMLVSTGVLAAILALALQSTLSDLFSGIALSLEQPYGIGDWIELDDGTLGQVVDISWRSTKLLSFQASELTIPNAKLAGQRVHNYDRPTQLFAQWFEVLLPSEIEPTTAKRMLMDAITRCRHVLHSPPPSVRLTNAGRHPYTYFVYVHFRDYMAFFIGRDAMFREIDAEFRRVGISVAAPAQEVYVSRRGAVQMQPTTVAGALRTVDLFTVLGEEQIGQLAESAELVVVEADQVLMRQGQRSQSIYVVWSGLLRAQFRSAEGIVIDVEDLQPGASFGQIAAITDEDALVTVTATTESVVIRVDAEAIRPLVHAQPELARRFAKVVADRLQSVSRARAARAASNRSGLPTSVAEIRKRLEGVLFGPGPEPPPSRRGGK